MKSQEMSYTSIKTCMVITTKANESIRAFLNAGNYVWFSMDDTIGNREGALVIYNICRSDAANIGKSLGLDSVSWINLEIGEKCRSEGFGDALNDLLCQHDAILSKAVECNLRRINEDKSYKERKLRQILSDSTSPRGRWEARGSLYSGYKRHYV